MDSEKHINPLKHGTELKFIESKDGVIIYSVGQYHVKSITVNEFSGKSPPVPWARIEFANERGDILVNLAHVLVVG